MADQDEHELVSGETTGKAESAFELTLRPQSLADYICLLYTSDAADEL